MGFFLRCGAALMGVCAGRSFTVGNLQGTLKAARFHGVIPAVCGWAALWRLRRTILHPPLTTPTLSNLIPETSGPDKPANEAFPAALSVCLPSGASNRQCRTLQTASGKIRQPAPPTQPSADTGVIGAVCCKPDSLKTPSISIFFPSSTQIAKWERDVEN